MGALKLRISGAYSYLEQLVSTVVLSLAWLLSSVLLKKADGWCLVLPLEWMAIVSGLVPREVGWLMSRLASESWIDFFLGWP